MSKSSTHRLALLLTLGLTTVLYFYDLGHTPTYLGGDEAHFGVQGYSIASTGRNLKGHFMPLFISLADPLGDPRALPWGNLWYQPMLFYLVAAVLKFVPLTEAAVRVPTAFIGGVLNPLLMYAVAMRLFNNRGYALGGALLLALTPPHLMLSRQAMDYVCPLPFVLGWLWCLIAFVQTGKHRLAAAGGVLLGIGCYSYIASWVVMPICLGLSWFVYSRAGRGFARPSLAAGAGFALPLLVLLPWLWSHPEMVRETVDRYRLPDSRHVSLLEESERTNVMEKVRTTISAYAGYFDPVFLFVRGGPSLLTSTGRAGVFLVPVAVFLPAGMYALWRRRDQAGLNIVLLSALAIAPIPAALLGEPYMIQRALFVLVFVVLISVAGLATLLSARSRAIRAVAVLLVAVVPVQFAVFYHDFFTHYERRSAFYYDSGAFSDTVDYVITADAAKHAPAICLNVEIDDVSVRWRFYATKHDREDLLQRTQYFSGDGMDLGTVAQGTLMVMAVRNLDLAALVRTGKWSLEKTVLDVDRRPASAILRKIS